MKLWERANRLERRFRGDERLTNHGGLPSQPQGLDLQYWEWRADGLYFLGATQDTQIRLRYQKAFPDIVDRPARC